MGEHGEEEERLGFTYDVFISFRGEDTRYTFIGHLRRELGRKGIKSFNDDNMRIGESLSPALSKAIEESKIFIVVFSENYASSTRCLDELVTIMKCSEKQLVYPVFYHVDPSDIRHERNSFGKHMKAHENEIGKESQKMQDWRSALSKAVDFPGRHITTGDERYFIEEIVGKVHEYITPKPLYSGQNPVGLEVCIEEVTSLLDMKPDDKIKMDDLLFTSPDPVYSDEMPLVVVPTKDDMEEYQMIIESLGLDESFKKEWLDNKERGGFEGMAEDDSMHIVLGELQRISQDAKNELKSKGSALEDPKSKLRWILNEIKNDDGKSKVTIIGDLALIRLKDPVKQHNVEEASTSVHTGSEEEEEGVDPQLEEILRDIFDEGMKDGLLEAHIRFPSLDIVETIRAALEKGYRVRWTPEAKVQTSVESRTYISGIYSGLLEAKLRFPDLDMWATINIVAKRKGITETFGSPNEAKLSFPHLDWTTETPPLVEGYNPLVEEMVREIFNEGMEDGVLEAQNRFPSLDIADTISIALGKGSGIEWTPKGMEIIPSAENRAYLSGVYGGLLEAKLRFPDLDVWETLNTVANRKGINTTFVSPQNQSGGLHNWIGLQ